MTNRTWNDLTVASRHLLHAQEKARLGRIGVHNPIVVLRELENVIVDCSKVFDAWSSSQPDSGSVTSDQALILLKFNMTMARGCSQFLEYGKEFVQLPEPDNDDLASPKRSAAIRRGFLRVIKNIDSVMHSMFADSSNIEPLYLELDVLKLKAEHAVSLHQADNDSSRSKRLIADRSEQLFNLALNHLAAGTTDPEEIFQWCTAGACSVLLETDAERGTNLLKQHDFSTLDDSVAWELTLMRVQALIDTTRRVDAVTEFITALKQSRYCDDREKHGRGAMASRPIHYIASRLIESNDSYLAVSVLEAYAGLHEIEPIGGNLLRVLAANDSLYGILSTPTEYIAIKTELQTDDVIPLLEASATGCPEAAFSARKKLGQRLRPLLSRAEVLSAAPLTIDALGFTSWFPWHAMSTGSGHTFGTETNLRWRHPLGNSRTNGPVNLRQATLLVDEALNESAKVIRSWRETCGKADARIVTFSSEDEGISEEDFSAAFEGSSMFVYYGHGVSDPEDSSQRGLYIGPDRIMTNSRLRELSGSAVSVALIIACESGRGSPFVSGSSPAQAIASAGASTVISSLWTIWARDGEKYASEFFRILTSFDEPDAGLSWLEMANSATPVSTPFYCMQ